MCLVIGPVIGRLLNVLVMAPALRRPTTSTTRDLWTLNSKPAMGSVLTTTDIIHSNISIKLTVCAMVGCNEGTLELVIYIGLD